jgi:hypothetical protein
MIGEAQIMIHKGKLGARETRGFQKAALLNRPDKPVDNSNSRRKSVVRWFSQKFEASHLTC